MVERQYWPIVPLLIADIAFRWSLALSINVQGDPAAHALLAREIQLTGAFPSEYPFFVTDPGKGWPIAYPQFFFLLLAGGYTVAGEAGMKAIPALLGTLSVFLMFFYSKRLFGVRVASLAAIILIAERHVFEVMVEPFMESALTLFFLVAFFEFHYYIETKKRTHLALAIAGLGLLVTTKQQAYVVFLSLLLSSIVLAAHFRWSREPGRTSSGFPIRAAAGMILGALVVGSPFIALQLQTAGTVDYPPELSVTRIFLTPKWTVDPISMQWFDSLRSSTFQHRYVAPTYVFFADFGTTLPPTYLLSFATAAGFIALALDKRRRTLAILVGVHQVTFTVLLMSWELIWRYLIFVPLLSTLVAAIGLEALAIRIRILATRSRVGILRALESHRIMSLGIVVILVAVPTAANLVVDRDHAMLADDVTTGGLWPGRVDLVREAGGWLRQNTNDSALILVDRWMEVAYYSSRRVITLNELGAHNVPRIYSSYDPSETELYLREYGITHIWVSQLQIDRAYYEKVPRHGLFDYVDYSPLFLKVYQNPLIRIYRVEYDFDPSDRAPLQLYANRFGDPDDFYDESPITLQSASGWIVIPGFGATLDPSEASFMTVWIDAGRTQTVFGTLQIPGSLFLFYRDEFTGDINVTIRLNSTSDFVPIATITGGNSGGLITFEIAVADLAAHMHRRRSWDAIVFGLTGSNLPTTFFGGAFIVGNVSAQERQWILGHPLGDFR